MHIWGFSFFIRRIAYILILSQFEHVFGVRVKVEKPSALPLARCPSVEIIRTRQWFVRGIYVCDWLLIENMSGSQTEEFIVLQHRHQLLKLNCKYTPFNRKIRIRLLHQHKAICTASDIKKEVIRRTDAELEEGFVAVPTGVVVLEVCGVVNVFEGTVVPGSCDAWGAAAPSMRRRLMVRAAAVPL